MPNWLIEFEHRFGLGGVILFDYNCQTRTYENNIYSPEQVRSLCTELAQFSSKPLLFVDQEGGKVRRLKEQLGFAPLPSQFSFNKLSEGERRSIVIRSFKELRQLGFHINLAPVVDLNINPDNPDIGKVERSYSNNPEEIRTNVTILNSVAERVNLGLCVKHFPGLGGAEVNSHTELTDLSSTLNEVQLNLLYELGQSIIGQSVLVSHGFVRQWDDSIPVSMSSESLRRLRDKIPNALLISDDLQMGALKRKYTTSVASKRGIQAGLDMVIIGNNLLPEDEHVLECAQSLEQETFVDSTFRERVQNAISHVLPRKKQFIRL